MAMMISYDLSEAMACISYCADQLEKVSPERARRLLLDFNALRDKDLAFDVDWCDALPGPRVVASRDFISLLQKHGVAPALPDVLKKSC